MVKMINKDFDMTFLQYTLTMTCFYWNMPYHANIFIYIYVYSHNVSTCKVWLFSTDNVVVTLANRDSYIITVCVCGDILPMWIDKS